MSYNVKLTTVGQDFIRDDIRLNAIMHRLCYIVLYLIHYWQYGQQPSWCTVHLGVNSSPTSLFQMSLLRFPLWAVLKIYFSILLWSFSLRLLHFTKPQMALKYCMFQGVVFTKIVKTCRLCYIVLYLIHYWQYGSSYPSCCTAHLGFNSSPTSLFKWVYYAFPVDRFVNIFVYSSLIIFFALAPFYLGSESRCR